MNIFRCDVSGRSQSFFLHSMVKIVFEVSAASGGLCMAKVRAAPLRHCFERMRMGHEITFQRISVAAWQGGQGGHGPPSGLFRRGAKVYEGRQKVYEV